MLIESTYDRRDIEQSFELTQKWFSRMPCQDEKQIHFTEAQKVDKYNCVRAFQMCLEDDF